MDRSEELLALLDAMHHEAEADTKRYSALIEKCVPEHRESARNLLFAARTYGIPASPFHTAGVASPADCVEDVEGLLHAIKGRLTPGRGRNSDEPAREDVPDVPESIVEANATRLFAGAPVVGRGRIMITLGPEEMQLGKEFLAGALRPGIDVVRINSARVDPEAIPDAVKQIHEAGDAVRRRSRILIDLSGPKLRIEDVTGEVNAEEVGSGSLVRVHRERGHFNPTTGSSVSITTSDPKALDAVQIGHRVWFDDGKIGGTVEKVTRESIAVRITHPTTGKKRLKHGRSINLPDTTPNMALVSERDRRAMQIAATCADLLSFSFVRTAGDVRALVEAVRASGGSGLGLVVKIENQSAVEHLAEILLALMSVPRCGVLLARGDLAVECGFDRLPEIQERVFVFARAAGLPLFLATEVLDRLVRKGTTKRAEVIDAAVARRAQCVMLNRGVHLSEAVRLLNVLYACKGTPGAEQEIVL